MKIIEAMKQIKDQFLVFKQLDNTGEQKIINAGKITAADGLIGIVAPQVINTGLIIAKAGKVSLGSGDTFTLDLYGDNLFNIAVSEELKSQLIINSGKVIADGSSIVLTAAAGKELVNSLIVNSGALQARSVFEKNGEIIITAEGSNAVTANISEDKGKKSGNSTVLISGLLDVSGLNVGESGGKLKIIGDNIGLLSGTVINASGFEGQAGTTLGLEKSAQRVGSAGGEILIGGDYLGSGLVPAGRVWVVCFQVRPAVARGQAGGQRAPYVFYSVREPVAAQNPDDGFIAVSAAQEFAITERARLVQNRRFVGANRRSDRWSVTRLVQQRTVLLHVLLRPDRHHADVKPQRFRLVHHPVHMLEVGLVGVRRVAVHEHRFAVSIRSVESAPVRGDGLDDREFLGGAVFQVELGIFTSEVEQGPFGVAHPEERRAIRFDEEPSILRDAQPRERRCLHGKGAQRHDGGDPQNYGFLTHPSMVAGLRRFNAANR